MSRGDGPASREVTLAMWCALCDAAGDLLAGLCEHDDLDYVNASPAARWLMRRLLRRD